MIPTREAALEAAARKLIMMAVTSGGTAGRDEGLVEAVDAMQAALATHAPSDKIAEAARVLLYAPGDVMTGFAIDVMRANRLRDGKRIGYQTSIIAALRALAGKGE